MVVPHTPASSKHTGWDCRQTTLGKVCVNVHNGLASHCCISITLNACIVYFELIQITWITCNTSQHSQRLWFRHRYSLHCTNLCYLVISLFNNPGHDSWCHFKLDVLLAKLCSSVCQYACHMAQFTGWQDASVQGMIRHVSRQSCTQCAMFQEHIASYRSGHACCCTGQWLCPVIELAWLVTQTRIRARSIK